MTSLTANALPAALRSLVAKVAKGNVIVELTIHAGKMDLHVAGIMSGSATVRGTPEALTSAVVNPTEHWMGDDGESRSSATTTFTAGAVVRRFGKMRSNDKVRVSLDVVLPAPVDAFGSVNLSRIVKKEYFLGIPRDEIQAVSVALDTCGMDLPGHAIITAALADIAPARDTTEADALRAAGCI